MPFRLATPAQDGHQVTRRDCPVGLNFHRIEFWWTVGESNSQHLGASEKLSRLTNRPLELAGTERFERPIGGLTIRCLAAWLHASDYLRLRLDVTLRLEVGDWRS